MRQDRATVVVDSTGHAERVRRARQDATRPGGRPLDPGPIRQRRVVRRPGPDRGPGRAGRHDRLGGRVDGPARRAPIDHLLGRLADCDALLVFDNCEHLVEGVAALVASIVKAAPHVRVLATSRVSLALPGEAIWSVHPLQVVPAVELFTDRARFVRPGSVVDEANRHLLERLVAQLDGIPLAIEMAAARLAVLSLAQIVEHLDDRFRLLTNTGRRANERQQSLTSVIGLELRTARRDRASPCCVGHVGVCRRVRSRRSGSDRHIQPAHILARRCSDRLGHLVEHRCCCLTGPRHLRYRMLETVRQQRCRQLDPDGRTRSGGVHATHYDIVNAIMLDPAQVTYDAGVRFGDEELGTCALAISCGLSATANRELGLSIACHADSTSGFGCVDLRCWCGGFARGLELVHDDDDEDSPAASIHRQLCPQRRRPRRPTIRRCTNWNLTAPAVVQALDSTPLIGTVTDADSGVAANGVTVSVTDWQNASVGGNLIATIDGTGNWQASQPFETAPYGRYDVVATAEDELGNSATTTQPINLDGLPPYADVTRSDNYFITTSGEIVTGIAGEMPYPSDGRTLHLHFEDGAGLWADGSETKFDMQCANTACPTSGVAGKHGTAITFDGVDDLLGFGGNEAITTTVTAGQLGLLDGSFTVMAWVNADDWTGNFPILGSSPITVSEGLAIGLNNGFPTLGYGGDDTTLSEAIPSGEWVHVTWRFDVTTGERSFFVNGVAVGDPTTGHSALAAEDEIELGRARSSNYYGGALDELVIYGLPLDAETIYDIANPVNSTISEMSLRIRDYAQRDIGQYAGTWNPVTLDTSNALYTTWQYALPTLSQRQGWIDSYKIDLLVTDSSGNTSFIEGAYDFAVIDPDVAVSKQTDATLVEKGDTIAFTINYTNTGLAPVTGVVLRETVPVDSSFDAGLSDAGWNCTPDGSAGNECTLAVGALAAGESGSAEFVVTAANAWSAGTIAIANTVTIEVDGNDSTPTDNIGTADVPINGGVDLAVSIVSDGTPLHYNTFLDLTWPTPVYTITYSNLSTDQTAIAELVEPLPAGVSSNFANFQNGWICDSINSGGTCTYQLGELAPGASGTVTFTFSAYFTPPPTNVVTNTVSIRDVSGVTDFNPANDEASTTTPYVLEFAMVPSQDEVVVIEGATAVLTGTVVDSSGAWSMTFPGPSVGTITQDEVNLTWTWMYTTTDGLDESQMVDLVGQFNEGGVVITHTFPLTVVNVIPTLPVTGTDQVASGATYNLELGSVIDPGNDTVTACTIDWGTGIGSICPADPTGYLASNTYGTSYANPTIIVYLTDEDGTHVAATKTITVTGITTNLAVDNSSVSAFESQTVTNSGTYSPLDASYSWSASEGAVLDEGNGVWSWSLPSGSAEGSRTVTINAGGQQTTFTVNVLGDGAASDLEDGAPNGGDGNNDGTPDSAQMHVASLPSPITGQYVTLAASPGMTLTNVSFPATPTSGAGSLPATVSFPLGFPTFNLTGMGAGGSAELTVIMTTTTGINTYYKYDATNGWYEFLYDTVTDTGAEVLANSIALYFVDGGRGDSDLTADGVVTDPGGPAFQMPTYDLTVTTQGNGAVSIPSGTYIAGTVVNLEITEAPGWGFTGWQGALSGSQISQTLTMNQDQSVTAVFEPLAYTLDIRVVGNGSVTRAPLQATYAYTDVVALNAVAGIGWSFSSWSGDLSSSSASENVTIDGNLVITGTFTQESYTVTTSVSGNGSVVVSPDQAGYVYGDVVSVQAVPDPGYALQSWSGDLSGNAAGQSLTIDGNKSATAIFATATYTVATAVEGSGSILLDPLQSTYSYGDVISVTAQPATDWQFANWTLGLDGMTATQSLTVTGYTSLLAVFEPVTYDLHVGWIGDGTAQTLSGETEFGVGEVVTVTATIGPNHEFTGWREANSELFFSTSLTTTVIMTGEQSIVAVFSPLTYRLDVNLEGTGSGNVLIEPIDTTCGVDCSEFPIQGSVITLTASADPGSTFASWSGGAVGTTNPVTITVSADTVVTATFSGSSMACVDVNIVDGWNMLSLPVRPADPSVATLFPNATSPAYMYQNGYVAVTSLTPGQGVWLKFDAAETVNICGDRVTDAVSVTSGWNIIGIYDQMVDVDLIGTTVGSVDSPFYSYANGYVDATILTPGQGYWVKVSADGTLNWATRSALADENGVAAPTACTPTWTATMTVTDAGSGSQQLRFGEATGATTNYDAGCDVEAPPPPPTGGFDGRFVTSNNIGALQEYQGEANVARVWKLLFQAQTIPISLTWDPTALPTAGFFLRARNAFTGDIDFELSMNDNSSLQVPSVVNMLQIEYEVPTVITLVAFNAQAQPHGAVLVTWETAVEIDNAGFNVYRSPSAEFDPAAIVQVNSTLIPAQAEFGQGASYELVDESVPPGVWYYFLEDVDLGGIATRNGPVRVDTNTPTSVGIIELQSGSPTLMVLALLLLVMSAFFVVLAGHTRRRRRIS